MELDAKTQAFVDGLINKRIAEVKSKHESAMAAAVAEAEAKVQGEIESLRAAVQKYESERTESNERVRQALLEAAIVRSNAVNEKQVAKLIGDNIAIGNDGSLQVVDDKGNTRLDEAGRPYGVQEFVKEYLDDNPHLVKASRSTGAGSMSATFFSSGMGAAKTIRRGEFDEMDPAQKSNFIQSGGSLTD